MADDPKSPWEIESLLGETMAALKAASAEATTISVQLDYHEKRIIAERDEAERCSGSWRW